MVLAYIKFIKRGIICILGLVTYTFCAAFLRNMIIQSVNIILGNICIII